MLCFQLISVTVDWPINITLGLLINIIVEDHPINGRSPEQYNRGRSPDRNTSKFNAYRPTTPPPSQRSYSPYGQRSASPRTNSRNLGYCRQRSPSPGYRANQSATPTTESLNSNGSGKSIGHETSPHDKTEQMPTSSSDIVIRRTIGKSLAVRGTIYGQNVSMIVDTAAMITLVNTKLIPADNEDSETVTLRGLGEQLVTGKIIKNTSLDIDRVNIQWDVCKAPLTDDVILGLDILNTLGAVINLSTPILTINNKVINAAFVNSGGEISIQQVCIKRTITVPPNSEMTVTIKTNKSADQEFILEPCPLTSCVLVSHVVGKGNSCFLTILNDGNRHIRLKKVPTANVVAFSVALSQHLTLGPNQAVQYDRIITNFGNAYDSSHGHMITPLKGMYIISVTCFNEAQDTDRLELVQNGESYTNPEWLFQKRLVFFLYGIIHCTNAEQVESIADVKKVLERAVTRILQCRKNNNKLHEKVRRLSIQNKILNNLVRRQCGENNYKDEDPYTLQTNLDKNPIRNSPNTFLANRDIENTHTLRNRKSEVYAVSKRLLLNVFKILQQFTRHAHTPQSYSHMHYMIFNILELPTTNTVAFSVVLDHEVTLVPLQVVKYNNILTNVGSAYDPRHGHASIPIKGIYLVAVTSLNHINEDIHMQLVRNDDVQGSMYLPAGQSYDSMSQTLVLFLDKSDLVWVRVFNNNIYVGHKLYGTSVEFYNTFSATLLFPL
ncbi:C1QL [Mytilus coruscus]|uniref:C1QL n=1 Tax=Mytilus coruscus TaxID=42192 RepID=A0A6J8ABF6_MYTCO|nr:C1QL [Mytilus coruscus]